MGTHQDFAPGYWVNRACVSRFAANRCCEGVGGWTLKPAQRKGRLPMIVMVANRTREIRPSGMTQEASGNVGHGGIVLPPRNRKGGAGNPLPTAERTRDLSKPNPAGRATFNCYPSLGKGNRVTNRKCARSSCCAGPFIHRPAPAFATRSTVRVSSRFKIKFACLSSRPTSELA